MAKGSNAKHARGSVDSVWLSRLMADGLMMLIMSAINKQSARLVHQSVEKEGLWARAPVGANLAPGLQIMVCGCRPCFALYDLDGTSGLLLHGGDYFRLARPQGSQVAVRGTLSSRDQAGKLLLLSARDADVGQQPAD